MPIMDIPHTPEPDAHQSESARVLRRFRILFNAVKSHFREVERKAGLAGAQVWALSIIRDHPGIGVSGLAKAMDIHQSTASNLLRALTEKGYVTTSRAETDRRAVELQITAPGLQALEKVPGPYIGVLPQALAGLDEGTLGRLDRDLGKLVDLLDVDRSAANIPLGQPDT